MAESAPKATEEFVDGSEPTQYLTFTACKEDMAINILDVEEIIEVGGVTRVPMAGTCIRGVINLRGNVVPVVDLSVRLGGKAYPLTKHSCIILVAVIVDGLSQVMGMLVDEVKEILDIKVTEIQAPPDFGTDIDAEFIRSMGRVGEGFIPLLNIDSVLSVSDLAALRSVTDGHARVGAQR